MDDRSRSDAADGLGRFGASSAGASSDEESSESPDVPPVAASRPKDLRMLILAILIGLVAGAILGTQPSVNGQLGRNVAHPLQASMISFASGTAILLVLTIAIGRFPPQFTVTPSQLPWWIWTGGAIGVVMVSTSLFFVPRVGSLPWFAAVMTGQTVAALMLDHFGMLGNPKSPASPFKILGTLLLIIGVLLIVASKHAEQSRMNAPPETPSDLVKNNSETE